MPDRHGRLADDHRRPAQPWHQRVDHGVHVAQVGAVFALLLRGSDAEEVHVGELRGVVVVGGEPQPAGIQVVAQHLSQARFVERDVTRRQLGDLARIDVDPDHLVAEFGHPGGVRRAEVPRAEHCASHTALIGRPDVLTATGHLAPGKRQVAASGRRCGPLQKIRKQLPRDPPLPGESCEPPESPREPLGPSESPDPDPPDCDGGQGSCGCCGCGYCGGCWGYCGCCGG